MRTLAVVLGFLMVTTAVVLSNCTAEALVSGHVDSRLVTPRDVRGSAYGPVVPMPVAAVPAGVEILMCVR
jgi:hypothetical protein